MTRNAYVIGAGITGLSAGWKLSEAGLQVMVREKEDFIGGMSSTFQYKDYYLDYGPHKIFTVMDHIMDEIYTLFEDESLLSIEKKSHIRLKGKYLSYPVGMKDVFISIGLATGLKCGFGYLASKLKGFITAPDDSSYEKWVVNRFGRPTYELVLGPYARKIWGNPTELSKDLAETRIAMPSLMEMVKQMIMGKKKDSPVISADKFFYPQKGFAEISEKMANGIIKNGGNIILNCGIRRIECDLAGAMSAIHYSDGRTDVLGSEDIIISTIPLQCLIEALPKPEETIHRAVHHLNTRKLILLFVVLDKSRVTDDNWLFFPEGEFIFNRIFEQKGFNSEMIPKDRTVLCVEITCSEEDSIWRADDAQVYAKALSGLNKAGLVKGEVIDYFTKRLDQAYPIYNFSYRNNLDLVMDYLDQIPNLYSIGRQGCYSYAGMADCMDMGISTANYITNGSRKRDDWCQYRQRFYNYVVVD